MEISRRLQLVDLLRHFGLPLIAVEIGVCSGAFSHELLGQGLDKLFSVDVWQQTDGIGDINYPNETFHDDNYIVAKERLSEFGDKSVMIKAHSQEAYKQFSNETFGLIYMDGPHDEIGVIKDFEVWWPKLIKGGIMAWHDFSNVGLGVDTAVAKIAEQNNLTIHFIPESSPSDGGAWVQKSI